MKSRIDEEICPVEETQPPKKSKSRRKKKPPVDENIAQIETDAPKSEAVENYPLKDTPRLNELANVRCLECHCVGTVMKTIDGIILFPNKVKKTLLDLGGGFFGPHIKKAKPVETVKVANQKAKKFMEGFNQNEDNEEDVDEDSFIRKSIKRFQIFRERFARGVRNARTDNKMKVVKMMERLEREKTKTPATNVPERFTGFFSDEFETDNFWKSKKRFSLHGNATMPQFAVYMLFGCVFWGTVVGITNYYSMLAARIQPTYLTNLCQAGFKNCSVTNDMDYCAHLLHDCIVTRNFTQPAAIKIPDEPEALPLTFTDKENKVNQRRCKKQKFYDRYVCRHLCSETLVLESSRNKASAL